MCRGLSRTRRAFSTAHDFRTRDGFYEHCTKWRARDPFVCARFYNVCNKRIISCVCACVAVYNVEREVCRRNATHMRISFNQCAGLEGTLWHNIVCTICYTRVFIA